MLIHGYNPESRNHGPYTIYKRQLACTSYNVKAISLSSIVAKLLDVIILSKDQHALAISHLQFGFKQDMSTIHCTYVMV